MEYIIIIFFILLFALLNILPLIVSLFHIPPETIVIGIPHWYEDYFYYLSLIKQGQEGSWQAMNWYTLEPIPPSPGYWCYLLLGKINMIVHLDPWILYNATLFISTLVFLGLSYMVIRTLIPNNPIRRIIAYSMATASTAFIHQGTVVTFFFAPTLSLNRLGGTIHQVWINCFSLLFFLLIASLWKKHSQKIVLLAMGVQILLFSLNPSASLMTLLAFGMTGITLSIVKKNRSIALGSIGYLCLFCIPLLPIFLSYIDTVQHPYYQFTLLSYSKYFARATPWTLFLSMGSVTLFAFIGCASWWKEKQPMQILGFFYIIIPIIIYLSPIPGFFNLPYERILQPAMYAFMGALGAYGITTVASALQKTIRIKNPFSIMALFFMFLLFSSMGIAKEVQNRFNSMNEIYFFNTLEKDTYDGLKALGNEPFGAVFGSYRESLYVPILSGKPVYAAHRTLTINYDAKMHDINDFLNLRWTSKDARIFFQTNMIRYVIVPYGKDVQERIQAQYPFLTPLFSNTALSYYNVETTSP